MEHDSELHASYDRYHTEAVKFSQRLTEQLVHLLAANHISLAVPIEVRVKDWRSILNKCERRKLFLNSVLDLEDLIGIRLILLFSRDVAKVCETIEKSLLVIDMEDVSDRLGNASFGYQSRHLTIKLPESWKSVPSFASLENFLVEIQVRTAAQHIWAAAAHLLQYKQEASVPSPILRSINRAAALLETVDLEFERVLEQRAQYIAALPTGTEEHDTALLNVDVLQKILRRVLPSKYSDNRDDYDELLGDLLFDGVATVGDLKALIAEKQDEVLKIEEAIEAKARRAFASKPTRSSVHVPFDGWNFIFDRKHFEQTGRFHTMAGLIRLMLSWTIEKQELREKMRKKEKRQAG